MRGGGSELDKKDSSSLLHSVPLVSGACRSLHAVSVLCQSRPQSVVPEKQPLPPQLAVLVGRTSSLLRVDWAPPVGGGGPSSLTALDLTIVCKPFLFVLVSSTPPSPLALCLPVHMLQFVVTSCGVSLM